MAHRHNCRSFKPAEARHACGYSRLRRPLRTLPLGCARALQYRRRCLRSLGEHHAAAPGNHRCRERRSHDRSRTMATCARPPTGSPMPCRGAAYNRETGWLCCCRRAGTWRSPMWQSTSSAPSPCLWRTCSASTHCATVLTDSGAKALITHAGGLARLDDADDDFEHPELVVSIDGPAGGA